MIRFRLYIKKKRGPNGKRKRRRKGDTVRERVIRAKRKKNHC